MHQVEVAGAWHKLPRRVREDVVIMAVTGDQTSSLSNRANPSRMLSNASTSRDCSNSTFWNAP